jgi:ABC-type Na+ transport system ATPase subunit NatA
VSDFKVAVLCAALAGFGCGWIGHSVLLELDRTARDIVRFVARIRGIRRARVQRRLGNLEHALGIEREKAWE